MDSETRNSLKEIFGRLRELEARQAGSDARTIGEKVVPRLETLEQCVAKINRRMNWWQGLLSGVWGFVGVVGGAVTVLAALKGLL